MTMEGGVRQGPVTWPVTVSALLDPTIYLPSSGLPSRTERHGPRGSAGLQNQCGRVTYGSVGSTPAPLR